MPLDTAIQRLSLIKSFMPIPDGEIDQEDRHVFAYIFASPSTERTSQLDTFNKRGSMIYAWTPIPDGVVNQEDRNIFMGLFATPALPESLQWTIQTDAVTNWTIQ